MDLATCSAYCFKIAGLFFVGERIHKYFLFLTANFFTGVQALSLSTTPLIVAIVIESHLLSSFCEALARSQSLARATNCLGGLDPGGLPQKWKLML